MQKVIELQEALETAQVEVVAQWGDAAEKPFAAMHNRVSELIYSAEVCFYIEESRIRESRPYTPEESEERVRNRRVIYGGDRGDFWDEVQEAYHGIRNAMLPHMKRKPGGFLTGLNNWANGLFLP